MKNIYHGKYLNLNYEDLSVFWGKKIFSLIDHISLCKHYIAMKFSDFKTLKDDLGFFVDWQEKYAYIIEIGKQLPDIGEEMKRDDHLVPGCVSRVWLYIEDDPEILKFRVFSEALIVNGLLYIVCSVFHGKTFDEANKTDPELIFKELGLQEHLTPSRVNGLRSVILIIRDYIESKA